MRVNSTTELPALQQNNNHGNSDALKGNLASQVKGIKNMTNNPQTMPPMKQNKKSKHQQPSVWDKFASSQENIDSFKYELKNSGRPLVHFPPSARGDMNAYKYVGFLDESTRPLTIFEYYRCKKSSDQKAHFNDNLPTIIDHVNSMGNKFQEGRDYIICNDLEMEKLQKGVSNKKHYQYYDSIISVPSIRKAVHEQFRRDINSNSKIKSYFESKSIPCSGVENFTRENRLIMVNINKRKPESNWDPRQYRHTTPEVAHMQNLVDCIYDAKKAAHKTIKEDQFDICFSGSELTKTEQNLWKEYASEKGVNVHFFNDLVKEGFDRIEQREVLFALSDQYKSTIYLGHQSGVNEDAPILPRTNVYSLSEYLGQGQVGFLRLERRTQFDIVKQGPFGTPIHASTMGNFYGLRNGEFLTTEGILAAVQLKIDLYTQKHQPLDKLWNNLISKHALEAENKNSKIPNEHAVNELLSLILNDVENKEINAKDINAYRGAINIIVQRMKGEAPNLSEKAKEYFTNVMKQELSPHDSHEPLTRHEHKLEAQNAGIARYDRLLQGERIGASEQPNDDYFDWLYHDQSL
ncbi:hypothetical protein [Providencia burhodogranariea]|uniref:Uncharacterized protein n=1 Tax=Providencia burhodogranariea DSM 19968 TaxID=1141662 RepID=K8WSG0_9GAMM|nr:hypothetical protein [Providencia burhodogranariea]EKT63518.1 hypothetical protein OOA_04057 [Providencia burhodogranariea DSM 19968]